MTINLFDRVGSSTPDGLAPLSTQALIIIVAIISGISILYGILNFIRLWLVSLQQGNESSKEHLKQMTDKIMMGSFQYIKINSAIAIFLLIVFYLLIMTFQLSTVYLLGGGAAFFSSFYVVLVSGISYLRVVCSSMQSVGQGFATAKYTANSIVFTTLGITLSSILGIYYYDNHQVCLYIIMIRYGYVQQLLGLFVYFQPFNDREQEQLRRFADFLICYSFGFISVTLCTKITSLVYSKGSQNSFQVIKLFNVKIIFDGHNPMIISKAVGENINKSLSKTLVYLMYINVIVAVCVKLAALNIIGTDQQGQIIFKLAYQNTSTSILIMSFAMFFTLLSTIVQGSPTTQNQIKNNFMLKLITISLFLIGFISLACYLTLPAEFEIFSLRKQDNIRVESPLYPYLCIIIAMLLCVLLTYTAQLIGASPYFMYSLLRSCKTGGATCIISGLSMGYMYTLLPSITIAAYSYLCYYWLGIFGVGMSAIGFGVFIPYYMNVNLYHSIVNTSSLIGFVSKVSEQSISNLLVLNESKKYYEQIVFVHENCLSSILGYASLGLLVQYTKMDDLSLALGYEFAGLLIGAMYPYLMVGLLIKSCYKVCPILCYQIQQKQINQISFYESNSIFVLNSVFQIIKLFPLIILPYLLGLLIGIEILLGLITGIIISSIQLSISSAMSGVLWGNLRDEISYGRAKDQDNNDIGISSQSATSSQIGKNVGCNIKDCAGQATQIMLFLVIISTFVYQDFYIK